MSTEFFTGKDILIISPEPWDHLFVSKHNYAIELAKCNRVYFLNPPGKEYSCHQTRYKNVWEVNYRGFVRGLRFLPKFIQRTSMKLKFERLQQMTAAKFDCVWSFDNSVFFDFSFLSQPIVTICHIVDHSQDFQFGTAASTADLCLGISQNIVDRLALFNKNSYLMPHGISIDLAGHIDVTLPGLNTVKAIYAGNLNSRYLDRRAFIRLISENPKVDFIFLGSGSDSWEKKSNTFFLGKIERELLIKYLEKADVLLMLYEVEKFPDQLTNAHKLLEYLSAGKVTVSSFVKDYSDKSDLLRMTASNDDIPSVFSEVVSNLSFYNSSESIQVRKLFAARNTYSHRLQEIEQLIKLSIRK